MADIKFSSNAVSEQNVSVSESGLKKWHFLKWTQKGIYERKCNEQQ